MVKEKNRSVNISENEYAHWLFNVPGVGSGALILGIISGYPVGAKIVSDLRSKNEITKAEARKASCGVNWPDGSICAIRRRSHSWLISPSHTESIWRS